jgi:hypothetical protein
MRKLLALSEANLLLQNKSLLTHTTQKQMKYKPNPLGYTLSVLTATAALVGAAGPLQAQEKKPNILNALGGGGFQSSPTTGGSYAA